MHTIKSILHRTSVQVLIFLGIAIISTLMFSIPHTVPDAYDMQFHWGRVYELQQSWQHGIIWPILNFFEFNHTGTGMMIMYPYFNILPLAGLSFFIKLIPLTIIWLILNIWGGLLIGFYSCRSYTHQNILSFIFAISYVLSNQVLYLGWESMNYGELSAVVALPLLIFGFLNFLKTTHWQMLMWGLLLLAGSHVLSLILAILTLTILAVWNLKTLHKQHWINLSKAVGWSMSLSAIVWASLLIFGVQNQLQPPYNFQFKLIISVPMFIVDSLFNLVDDNHNGLSFTTLALVGLIFSAVQYKKIDHMDRQIFILGVIYTVIGTKLFPWHYFVHTFVNNLQFPHRFFIFSELFFCYLLARIIVTVWSNQLSKLLIAGGVLTFGILSMNFNELIVNQSHDEFAPLNHVYIHNNKILLTKHHGLTGFVLKNDKNVYYLRKTLVYNRDYMPLKALYQFPRLSEGYGLVGDQNIQTHFKYNHGFQYQFDTRRFKKPITINLPIYLYRGIHYQAQLDGKTIQPTTNNQQLFTLKNLQPGLHTIKFNYQKPISILIAEWYSLISFIVYFGYYGWRWIQKLKSRGDHHE